MASRASTEYRYEKLTWPEINDAVELGKVCIVPCGSVEQHAPHLPLDTDIVFPLEIARGAGRAQPDRILKDRPVDPRRDWHRRAPTMPMPWGQTSIKP